MKTLWTPWRIEHVQGNAPKPEGCLFEPEGDCNISKKALASLSGPPYSSCCLTGFPIPMVTCWWHPSVILVCITELTTAENCALMEMVKEATAILKNQLEPDGFNIGCNIGATAGAGIADHLHYPYRATMGWRP